MPGAPGANDALAGRYIVALVAATLEHRVDQARVGVGDVPEQLALAVHG